MSVDKSHTGAHGWYGPPNSRRWHYMGIDGRSLCGKWMVLAWDHDLVARAFGPADGDCAACKRALAKSQYATQGESVVSALADPANAAATND